VLAFLLFMSPFAVEAAPMVRVRPHIVATPMSEIKLSDVIDANELSAEAQEKMRSIRLTRAPAKGERQELAQAALMETLRPVVQRERKKAGRVHLVIPRQVII